MIPGEVICAEGEVEINGDKPVTVLKVKNTGDRPVQVGSHFHFFEVNKALRFDRPKAYGLHLNLPGGMSVRFEPGDEHTVSLVPFGGSREAIGFNGLVNGPLDAPGAREKAIQKIKELGFSTGE